MTASKEDELLDPIAREQAPILRNLFELYAHDFSEYVPVPLGADGRFGVDPGEGWWTYDGHYPFFLRHDGHLVGFALVRRGSRLGGGADVMDVAELFVTRGARRSGIGTKAVHGIFQRFPGRWEIRVRPTNTPARAFWERVIAAWTGASAEAERSSSRGVEWDVFRFDSRRIR